MKIPSVVVVVLGFRLFRWGGGGAGVLGFRV